MNFDRLNWIVGPSCSGKSSILAAIELAMGGTNAWTTKAGSGKDTQMGPYGKKTSISYTFNGVAQEYTIPSKITLIPIIDQEILRCCLRPRYFIGLSKKDQKDMISKIFEEKIDVKKAINEFCSSTDLSERFKVFAKDVHNTDIETTPIEELYKIAYEERKINKKELELVKKKLESLPKPSTWMPAESARKIVTDYNNLKEVKAAKTAIVNSMSDSVASSIDNMKRLVRLRKDLEEVEIQVTQTVANIKNEPEDVSESLGAGLAKVEKDIKMAITAREKFNVPGRCPPGECRFEKIQKAQAKIDELNIQREKVKADIQAFIDKKNEYARFIQSYDLLNMKHESLKSQVTIMESCSNGANMEELDKKKEDLINVTTTIGRMEKDFQCATENLALTAINSAKNFEKEIEELNEQLQTFEILCKALGPDGIKSSSGSSIKECIESANTFMKRFGLTCSWQDEELCFGKGIVHHPVYQACWTEQGIISAAFQRAIAHKSRLGLYAIDEHGMDPIFKLDLYETLFNDTVQVISLSTMTEVDEEGCIIEPKHPGDPGVKMFLVNKGNVTEILPEV
jgi:hypothetical protein